MTDEFAPSLSDRVATRVARTTLGRRLARASILAPARRRFDGRRLEREVSREFERIHAPALPSGGSTISRFESDPSSVITTRFIVLSEGRSGSTLLTLELGRRWPDIECARNEPFSPQRAGGRTFDEIVRETFFGESGRSIVGCKIIDGQLDAARSRAVLDLDEMHVILLRRRDLVRRHVSEEIARRTQQWVFDGSGPAPDVDERAVRIDPRAFVTRTARSMSFSRYCDALGALRPSIEVWYEDLDVDLDGQLRRIARFLGAGPPSSELPPRLVRQNPEPIERLVVNLDEVREYAQRNGLGHLFDDPERTTGPTIDDGPVPVADRPVDGPSVLLARAAFGSEGGLEANWNAWLDSDRGSLTDLQVLGATVNHRLRRAELVTDRRMGLPKIHAETSAAKALLLDDLDRAVAALTEGGIGSMVLGGAATCLRRPDATATMRLERLVISVPEEHVAGALDRLHADGWQRSAPLHTAGTPTSDAPTEVILHRGLARLRLRHPLLVTSAPEEFEHEAWEDSMVFDVADTPFRTLDPSTHLLWTLVDGVRGSAVSPARRIADARFAIVTMDDHPWDDVLARAARFGLDREVALAIDELSRALPDLVPATTVALARETAATAPHRATGPESSQVR